MNNYLEDSTVSNTSIEIDDSARSILKTYQQISDNVSQNKALRSTMRSYSQQKTKALEQELDALKEQYRTLQEDYENAIFHLRSTESKRP